MLDRADDDVTLCGRARANWCRARRAVLCARDPQDGLEVRGYNLENGTVSIAWESGATDLVVADVGWLDKDPLEDLPEHMQTAWVPFDWTQVPPGEWIKVNVKIPSGQFTTEPLHVRVPT